MEQNIKNELDDKNKYPTKNEEEKDATILEKYYKSFEEDMKGKPWYVRHKSTLLILGLTALGWIFCAIWSHYFPYGIM